MSEHIHFFVLCLSLLTESLHLISGIGLETTILFAREGAEVLMADISEPALATALAKVTEILPDHPRIQTYKCDVSKESEVAAMVDRLDSWGGVDIMFNNAGIMHANDADAIDTPEKIWDLTQAINVKGVWFGSKHAVLSLRKHKKSKGSIINTASVVALTGSATPQLAYTASKGAVLAMTRELAIVHAKEGFRFNSLCPAPLKYVHSLAIVSLGLLKRQISIFYVRCQQPKLTNLQHSPPSRLARRRRCQAPPSRSSLPNWPLRRSHRTGPRSRLSR